MIVTRNTQSVQPMPDTATDSNSVKMTKAQSVGRELFYHHVLRPFYDSAVPYDPAVSPVRVIFGEDTSSDGYLILDATPQGHGACYSIVPHSDQMLDEDFKYLAGRFPPGIIRDEVQEKELWIDDYREEGLTMNWDRARKLYRRMMER